MKISKPLVASLPICVLVFLTALAQDKPPQQPAAQPPQQQPPAKKAQEPEDQGQIGVIETTQVVVPVIVTDPFGRFVNGLRKSDFLLEEDNKRQEIDDFSDASSPFSVALLIDLSLSTRNKLDDIKHTAIEFVRLLQPRDRVLIVAFDEKVRFVGDFTGDQKELEKSIKGLKTSYLTSLYDAIDATVRQKLMSAPGRKAIVVLSDGVDTGSHQATADSVLDLVTRTGVISYSVRYETRNDGSRQIKPGDLPYLGTTPPRIGNFFQPPERATIQKQKAKDRDIAGIEFLQNLAVRSGALYIRSETAIMTAAALYRIADEIRNQYTLVYNPTNDKRDGTFRRISVNLKRDDLLLRARQGYYAKKPQEK